MQEVASLYTKAVRLLQQEVNWMSTNADLARALDAEYMFLAQTRGRDRSGETFPLALGSTKFRENQASTDLRECITLVAHVEKIAKEEKVSGLGLIFGGYIAVNFWRAAILAAAEEEGDIAQVEKTREATEDLSRTHEHEVKANPRLEILGCEGLSKERVEDILSRVFHAERQNLYRYKKILFAVEVRQEKSLVESSTRLTLPESVRLALPSRFVVVETPATLLVRTILDLESMDCFIIEEHKSRLKKEAPATTNELRNARLKASLASAQYYFHRSAFWYPLVILYHLYRLMKVKSSQGASERWRRAPQFSFELIEAAVSSFFNEDKTKEMHDWIKYVIIRTRQTLQSFRDLPEGQRRHEEMFFENLDVIQYFSQWFTRGYTDSGAIPDRSKLVARVSTYPQSRFCPSTRSGPPVRVLGWLRGW